LVVEALVREIEAEQADIAVRAKQTPDQFKAPVMQTGAIHRFPAVETAQRECSINQKKPPAGRPGAQVMKTAMENLDHADDTKTRGASPPISC
jgi:hypothetical protein